MTEEAQSGEGLKWDLAAYLDESITCYGIILDAIKAARAAYDNSPSDDPAERGARVIEALRAAVPQDVSNSRLVAGAQFILMAVAKNVAWAASNERAPEEGGEA